MGVVSLDLFTAEFWTILMSIIVIDLFLAGDNAIVIGMAARKLPPAQQKKAILWGMVGALIIRILATLAVVWLLKIPGLMLIGGILLVWIAYRLLLDDKEDEVKAGNSTWEAIRTIIVADAAMGLDNVLAVAGAAHNHFGLVIIGLLITVPIIVWGSKLFIKLIDQYPWIIYIGSGVLAWTAAKMIIDEKLLAGMIPAPVLFQIIVVVVVLIIGWWRRRVRKQQAME
jgi:YjbE family integral membrane protein